MTAWAQRREGGAKLFLVCGGQRRTGHGLTSCLRTSAAWALIVVVLLGAVQATAQPAAKFANLTSEQAQTLLALAHDYHPRDGVAESQYTTCIRPYDVQAGNAQDRQSMDEALALVEGAVRRMGYPSYAAITDEYERMRLAKMLAEKQWMKQFRIDVGLCLDRVAKPR